MYNEDMVELLIDNLLSFTSCVMIAAEWMYHPYHIEIYYIPLSRINKYSEKGIAIAA